MDNELLLITGRDIPFIEAQVTIHQPRLYEISFIGEENFLAGCQFINFTKDKINEEDRIGLEDKSDFEIFMSIMCSKEKIPYKESVRLLFSLIFPDYQVKFTPDVILLASKDNSTRIDVQNYDVFKDILNSMFCLKDSDTGGKDYNPIDDRAAKIVNKFRKRKEKIAQIKGDSKKVAIFSRYMSILATGLHMDINIFNNYTVFQLKDQIKRFLMNMEYNNYLENIRAGADSSKMDEIDNWMEDIHP